MTLNLPVSWPLEVQSASSQRRVPFSKGLTVSRLLASSPCTSPHHIDPHLEIQGLWSSTTTNRSWLIKHVFGGRLVYRVVPGSDLVTRGTHPSTRLLVLTLFSLYLQRKMFLSLFTPWKFCNHCLPMPSQNHSPPRRHLEILLPNKYSVLPKRNSGEDFFPISVILYFLVCARTAGGPSGRGSAGCEPARAGGKKVREAAKANVLFSE